VAVDEDDLVRLGPALDLAGMAQADQVLGEFALPSMRLAPCATMNGSKPSLRRPRRTSMVGM
jgi:hypothetical protein